MRIFIGIPLAGRIVAEIAAIGERLGSGGDRLRWTAPESWHITLQFLGSADPERCECVKIHLAEVRAPQFPIQLAELGLFERAGVFYAGVETSRELAALQQCVIAATRPCGFAPEERLFHPHITLARAKGRERAKSLRALQASIGASPRFTRFTAEEFLLYESFTGAEGARYEVRARYPLDGCPG